MTNKYASIVEKLQSGPPLYTRPGLAVEESHLQRVEAQLGCALPADYREFLRDYGGIEFQGAWFPLQKNDELEEGGIYLFYGSTDEQTLAESEQQSRKNYGVLENGYELYSGLRLVRDISHSVDEMAWPEELLVIGSDSQANHICLALFGLRPGAVFYWMNVPREEAQNLYLVANSFDEFMQLLRKNE